MRGKKLFNLRPLVLIAVGVCLGVTSAYFFYFNKIFLGILICLIFCGLCSIIFLPWFREFNIKSKLLLTLFMSALFIFCGGIFGNTVYDFDNANLNSHYYTINAKVIETKETSYGNRLLLDNVNLKGVNGGKTKYKIRLYVYGANSLDVGDLITFDARLDDLSSIYEYKFSADNVLRKIKYTANVDYNQIKVTGNKLTIFESVNLFIRDTLKSSLDYQEFSIAYAMLTGQGEYMDYETVTAYRTAGVAHIFAVSGLHIGFLATALGFLFKKVKINRTLSAFLISISLFFFAGVCGFSASSIRASIMSTVALLSLARGNRYDGLSSLALSAIIILCISPLQFFNVGFRLSFLVVLGIMTLSRPMSAPFRFLPKKISSAIGVAISAQIVGVALCLSTFGYFSPIAIIVNIIFIPIASVIFITLLLTTLIGGLFSIGNITLFVPNYILKFVNMCITAFDFEKLIVGDFSMGIFALFYYIALVFPSEQFNFRKITRIIATSICVLVCAVGSIFVTIKDNNTAKIYVRGGESLCFTIVDTPSEDTLILSDVSTSFSDYSLTSIRQRYGVEEIDTVIILQGFDCQPQQFITKLRTVFALNRICYYGEKNALLETIIKKSFGYETENFLDGQDMEVGGMQICYSSNGQVANFNIGGKTGAIFSCTPQTLQADGLRNCDLIICGLEQEILINYLKPKTTICYRRNRIFTDAESQGTAIFKV